MKICKVLKNKSMHSGSMHVDCRPITRTSAPLVKVNSTYMKHKV